MLFMEINKLTQLDRPVQCEENVLGIDKTMGQVQLFQEYKRVQYLRELVHLSSRKHYRYLIEDESHLWLPWGLLARQNLRQADINIL